MKIIFCYLVKAEVDLKSYNRKVTMENAMKIKFDLREIFKEGISKSLEEAKDVMKKEIAEENIKK